MKEIDSKKIEQAVRMLLEALGDDPEREGLVETPKRVAKMYQEVFEGMKYSNEELAEKYNKCFEDTTTGDLVVIGPVDVFSYCEHHMALMYDMQVYVGYIPNKKVIGLSKVARVADMCAKRLQLQERIGTDIYDVLRRILDTDDIIVVIEGSHSCMTARGIKKVGSRTKTASCNGIFMSNPTLRQEFYNLINK